MLTMVLRRIGFCITGSLILLSACTTENIVALPPQQVLERATDAVRDLSSATFHATASIEGLLPGAGAVSIASDGTMQDGGRQLALSVDATMDDLRGGPESSVSADIVVAGDDEVYLRLEDLRGDIPAAFFGSGVPPTGVWWQLPENDDGTSASSALSPDPALMSAQAHVVNVERDRGIDTVDGHTVYQYDTVVDVAKLRTYLQEVSSARGETFDADAFAQSWARLSIRGVLVIDAQTFFIRRIDWTFVPIDDEDGLRGTISMTLSDHNAAQPVVPPADAVPFPWSTLPTLMLP